ncbi:MAG: trypsin-like serine protease, partial [Pseudomonadota bacterium]
LKEVYCTGTAVSDSTLVSAAHCVMPETGQPSPVEGQPMIRRANKLCVAFPDGSTSCTDNVFIQASYLNKGKNGSANDMTFDVSAAVFPKGTFKYIHALQKDQPVSIGAAELMVGYSEINLFSEDFPKRWGRNTVQSLGDTGVGAGSTDADIVSVRGQSSSDKVAVSPGDSGGPLFNERCEVVGVASRMSASSDVPAVKSSNHISLAFDANRKFLESLRESQQASYCVQGDSCQSAPGFVAPINAKSAANFPCKSGAEELDPMINDALDKLANNRHNSSNSTGVVSDCDGGVGICVQYLAVEASNSAAKCDAAYIDLTGRKVLTIAELKDLYRDSPVSGAYTDKAFATLSESVSSNSADFLKQLRCGQGGAGSRGCCLKQVCSRKGRAGGDLSENVDCPAGVDDAPASKAWLGKHINTLDVRIAPDAAMLEQGAFPCDQQENMALRKTTGICYERPSSQAPVSGLGLVPTNHGGNTPTGTLKCWKVVKGAKTSDSLPCPAGL